MNGATRSECVVLDGKALAASRETQLAEAVRNFAVRHQGRVPTLATILVGDDPSSAVYVRMKGNACRRVGMDSKAIVLPASTGTKELRDVIDALNKDPDVHGILLQRPGRVKLSPRIGVGDAAPGTGVVHTADSNRWRRTCRELAEITRKLAAESS